MTRSTNGPSAYAERCRPKLADLLESLDLNVSFTKARGAYLYRTRADGADEEVLDLVGGFGAGLFGHNNAELKALLKDALDEDVPFLAQSSDRREAGRLAERLNQALPTSTPYMCHFANSGAEAVEAAVKHAYKVRFDALRRQFEAISRDIERFQRDTERTHPDIEIPGGTRDLGGFRDDLDEHNLAQFERFRQHPVVLAFKGAFHGKTATALKVTFNRTYREGFEGLSAVQPEFLDFDDVERLDEVKRSHEIAFAVPRVEDGRIVVEQVAASRIVAFCLEIIQGEGGIRLVPDHVLQSLADQHADLDIPFLIDEIQTGCGRTGDFVAYAAGPLGAIDPEYVTLSKALGGGLVKIGALLIRENVYDPDFGILHTSTFAEDEVSCRIATRVVDMLTRDDHRFMRTVADKGAYLLDGLRRLQERYPDVVGDVRGRGLLIGVEFADLADKGPLFRFGVRQGFLSLLVASYLLHHHAIRLLAPLTTLLKGNPGKKRLSVLRIQPVADISRAEMDRVLDALDEVFRVIARNNDGVLIGHLVGAPPTAAERRSPAAVPVTHPLQKRRVDFDARVGFVVHPAHLDQLRDYYFPSVNGRVDDTRLANWWNRLSRFLEPDVIHTDYVSADGFVVEANLVSVPYLPFHLVTAYARGERVARPDRLDALRLQEIRDKIQDAVTTVKELGDDHIPTTMVGLGAYTSIVTDRGTTVNDYEVPVTTGNAYTAGLMVEGILKAAGLQQIEVGTATAAVVGAAGNIGSVLAALLSGHVGTLKLVGREANDGVARLRRTRAQCLLYLANQVREQFRETGSFQDVRLGGLGERLFRELVLPQLRATDRPPVWDRAERWFRGKDEDVRELGSLLEAVIDREGGMEQNPYLTIHLSVETVRDCDVVTIATNSPDSRLITPALVKPGAIVSCASVPSNLSTAFKDHLDDYMVFDGGYARLPEQHEIHCIGLPDNGMAPGCLSETLLLGFEGANGSFARGAIAPEQVNQTLGMAERYGFMLGDLKLNGSAFLAGAATGGNGNGNGRKDGTS
jgi:acetylornithine/succinyldiaminopimelate/putrescine aminotransferase/predicted amino acid dehydrogenase